MSLLLLIIVLQLKFEERTVEESYTSRYGEQVTESFPIHIRPVMKWIKEMVRDPLISQLMRWYPVKKYLVYADGNAEQFLDDLDCGSKWWDAQVNTLVSLQSAKLIVQG